MAKKNSNNKSGKNSKNKLVTKAKRALIFKEDMEEYAQVTKMLGDLRVIVLLPNKTEVKSTIPGSFKKKRCFINIGDIVLVSKRTFEDKFDICYRYNDDEVKKLAQYFEIPNFFLEFNESCNPIKEIEVDVDFVDDQIDLDINEI